MKILFVGDIMGKPGRTILHEVLPRLRREHKADLVIVNGENSAGGMGITPVVAEELFDLGVNVITLGNHAWDKREIMSYIDGESRLIRPLNYPGHPPGSGVAIVSRGNGPKVAVLNLAGRVFATVNYDDPFRRVEEELERLPGEIRVIFVDFHGEATSEKVAMGWFLNGRVSAVVGTHTHVQTADERVLPKGTAYITDAGMTGPADSVIGIEKDLVIEKFLTQLPVRFEVARGRRQFNGILVEIDEDTGRAISITRIVEKGASN